MVSVCTKKHLSAPNLARYVKFHNQRPLSQTICVPVVYVDLLECKHSPKRSEVSQLFNTVLQYRSHSQLKLLVYLPRISNNLVTG